MSLRGGMSGLVALAAETSGKPGLTVRTYKTASQYERDARSMIARGWDIAGNAGGNPGKIRAGRTVGKAVVFLPWAFLRPSRKGAPVTVTWIRPAQAPATAPVVEVSAVPQAVAAEPTTIPGAWCPDPSGRHMRRWWDEGWTARVLDPSGESMDAM